MLQLSIIVLLLIAIQADISEGNSCICKNPDDWENVRTCYEMYKELSRALTNDKGNLYRMKQAFFYAPSADPVLIKVKYNISYGENVTEDQLLYCDNGLNELIAMMQNRTDIDWIMREIIRAMISEMITINQTEIIRGWTSRGVYYVINPLILNKMQMVLPFAILRLINNGSRLTSGSPEVDTFLWDGSYELPTLLINLTIASLPCIPSKEIFNCTLEELNANLKVYAKSQDPIQSSADVHVDASAIAYTLSEDRIMHPLNDKTDISWYIDFYCLFGYILIVVFVLNICISNNMKLLISISKKILEHVELIVSAVIVGFLLVISEFIATAVYLKDTTYYTRFHVFILVIVIFCIFWILFIILLCYKKRKVNFKIRLFFLFLGFGFLLFLIHIYCYALPTFLLMLVYPTKVITVVVYLATFAFATSIIYSICIRIIIVFYKLPTVNRCTKCMIIFNVVIIFLLPFAIFIAVIEFLYSLVLGEASAISAGPYTVLSLIPSAAISVVTWLVKNKVFSSGAKKEDENKDEEQPAANNGGTVALVVNEETPINGNSQAANTYGAADNN